MATNKDIQLDENFDLIIADGDFVIEESLLQEVAIILQMNQGELKSDPLIGANLVEFIRSGNDKGKIQRHLETQLELDDKDYDEIKDKIRL